MKITEAKDEEIAVITELIHGALKEFGTLGFAFGFCGLEMDLLNALKKYH
ncbi:hypothetical protein [Paenibacillus sp. S150]|nr:hypothetical protein [Paenibacillus sp. S150]MBW4081199.1 hypothetical protein [Paenibacillus sp. S150]